jgi:FKBP-type peptidyl-prolyl cis-trans isomerase (trigger factor)
MKAETKKIDSTVREMNVAVSGDMVKNKFEDVFKKISQEAKVPGFRPGHAPRDILEKNFSELVHEQVLKELIPEVYQQAIDQEKLDVVEMPQISDIKLDRNNLSFKAQVEVRPEIAVKNYKGIKINFKKINVSEDQVNRKLDSLKESSKAVSIDDSFAKGLSYPDLAELKSSLEKQIFLQQESAERQKIENQAIEAISKGLDFKLPKLLVQRQLDDLVRQTKLDLALKGMPREKISEQESEILKALEPQAKNQVKIYLILSEIAKKENIPLDDHMPSKVMELLLKEAEWKEES